MKFKELNETIQIENVKECPFCGNDYVSIKFRVVILSETQYLSSNIFCPDCSVSFPETIKIEEPLTNENSKELYEKNIKECLSLWDTRNLSKNK